MIENIEEYKQELLECTENLLIKCVNEKVLISKLSSLTTTLPTKFFYTQCDISDLTLSSNYDILLPEKVDIQKSTSSLFERVDRVSAFLSL